MDLRVERTYRSLTSAFTALLEETPYERITVAALCERAMIRRTTFYKHFADKDEFFVFFLKSIRDEFKERIGALEATSHSTHCALMLKELLSFLRDHGRLTENVVSSPNALMLFDALCEVIYVDSLRLLEAEQAQRADGCAGRAARADAEMLSAFMAGGILQMVRQWWAAGCPAGAEHRMLAVLESVLKDR